MRAGVRGFRAGRRRADRAWLGLRAMTEACARVVQRHAKVQLETIHPVIPAKAGTQARVVLGPGFRRDDDILVATIARASRATQEPGRLVRLSDLRRVRSILPRSVTDQRPPRCEISPSLERRSRIISSGGKALAWPRAIISRASSSSLRIGCPLTLRPSGRG